MKPIIHVDCFAGPGGITTGFKAAGIKTVCAIEKVESCVETFLANHPKAKVVNKDIRKVTRTDLMNKGVCKANVVTAGMPCETFSTAGSKSRSFYDSRQTLFLEGIRIAKMLEADLILLENVPAITSKRLFKDSDTLVLDLIYKELSKNGFKYFIDTILDSSDFGIPQKRKRFFILASKNKLELSPPISKRNGIVSVGDAFADLPILPPNGAEATRCLPKSSEYIEKMKDAKFWKCGNGWDKQKLTYHISPNHRARTIERFKLIKQGEGLKDLFEKYSPKKIRHLQSKGIMPKKWYIQRNRRLSPNELAPTVTSHCLDELLHPNEDRCLTVREVARLQSFPDYYNFAGGPFLCPHFSETQDKYEQIGDAVPPLLAYHWGIQIKKILGNYQL